MDQLGVKRSTVVTHLKQVFAKTGVSHQAELAALVERLATLKSPTGRACSVPSDPPLQRTPRDNVAAKPLSDPPMQRERLGTSLLYVIGRDCIGAWTPTLWTHRQPESIRLRS